MITVGERVKYAIDEVGADRFELAMNHVVIALDITAKRHYKKAKSSRSDYKNLIKDYFWLLEMMSFLGINTEDSIFGNYPIDGNNEPTLRDLIYHVLRCSLVHDEGIPNNFIFGDSDLIQLSNGKIVLPKKLIWGLLAIIVFCPCNKNEQIHSGYWLGIFEHRFFINNSWGNESSARAIYDSIEPIRVTLNIPHGHIV